MIALLWLALAISRPQHLSTGGDEMLAALFAAVPITDQPEPRWVR